MFLFSQTIPSSLPLPHSFFIGIAYVVIFPEERSIDTNHIHERVHTKSVRNDWGLVVSS